MSAPVNRAWPWLCVGLVLVTALAWNGYDAPQVRAAMVTLWSLCGH